jgi:hypothetical protein
VRIASLRQNFKQFVVGEKVESRESSTLDFQIVLHFLLNLLKFLIILLEFLQQFLTSTTIPHQRLPISLDHGIPPKLINQNKLFILFW